MKNRRQVARKKYFLLLKVLIRPLGCIILILKSISKVRNFHRASEMPAPGHHFVIAITYISKEKSKSNTV